MIGKVNKQYYNFICSFPKNRQNVDCTDRRRQVTGHALNIVEELREILHNRDPCNAQANHNKNKDPLKEKKTMTAQIEFLQDCIKIKKAKELFRFPVHTIITLLSS